MFALFRSKHPANLLPWYLALAFLMVLPASASAQAAPAPLKVITSIAPVYALAASVMKGAGTPHLFVRPNQSPHDYVLRPSDAQRLSEAQIVFWIGEELEPFLTRPLINIAPQADHVRLLDTPGLTLLSVQNRHDHQSSAHQQDNAIDPHIWLDIDNSILIIQAMAEKFTALDPSHAPLYTKNAQTLIEELQKIDMQ